MNRRCLAIGRPYLARGEGRPYFSPGISATNLLNLEPAREARCRMKKRLDGHNRELDPSTRSSSGGGRHRFMLHRLKNGEPNVRVRIDA